MENDKIISLFFEATGIQNRLLKEEAQQYLKVRQVTRGTTLFEQGQEITKIAMKVTGGLVRIYYINENGDEVTCCFDDAQLGGLTPDFDFEHSWISSISVEALNDFPTVEIAKGDLQRLIRKYPDTTSVAVRLMNYAMLMRGELRRVISEYTAEEKVVWFNQRFPELTGLVPERHIASFLNMSPVTLSRIRKKLRADNAD